MPMDGRDVMMNLTAALLVSACTSNGEIRGPRTVKVEAPVHSFAGVPVPLINTLHGISFSAPPRPVPQAVFDSIAAMGAEWVAVVPYAYGPGADGRLFWQGEAWQWWGETEQGIREQLRSARAAGLQVMLKPHLWLEHGAFTGTYEPASWSAFASSYQSYLLTYARMAEEEGAALFCIGTELQHFTQAQPGCWTSLIDSVRMIYKGQLTYAANWDEVAQVPFWPALDLIGVDGYFPLTTHATRNLDSIAAGWTKHTTLLSELSQQHDRQVLFTEIGYTCASNCTVEPWREDRSAARDDRAQAAAFTAFFQVMRQQPWYAGCFVWKWFADDEKHEELRGNGFSPQGKAAERVMREEFGSE
jgi:hypothetical protein